MMESLLKSGERSAIKTSYTETQSNTIAVLMFGQLYKFLCLSLLTLLSYQLGQTLTTYWGVGAKEE